ncbi:MAG TPA: protein translocase subunit SecF [Acidimicrobiales bacterium]|nr:protein translocase subunit SecF [Acidimicrobiales bacterium]
MSDSESFAPAHEHHYGPIGRLYHGLTTVDFVGRRKVWFSVSLTIIVLGIASLGFRGFNFGIDFRGGSSWEVLAPHTTVAQMTSVVEAAGLRDPTVEKLGSETYQVTADINSLSSTAQVQLTNKVADAMAKVAGKSANQVSTTDVGPSWGSQITDKAVEALIVFFIAVVAYISIRFEPKMAAAAFIAMIHDLLVTVGVYSLFGLQITPDTVIAILTILGYSLYDTVVVFDRVRDNTNGVLKGGDLTYSEMVNLSMNQTLARSINTSLVAILPVLAVLVVGADILGATTLQSYGLALFVGLMSGAYSSIFIASPLLAMMKEREPRYRDLAARVLSRNDRKVLTATSAALASAQATASTTGVRPMRTSSVSGTIQARARKQKRR